MQHDKMNQSNESSNKNTVRKLHKQDQLSLVMLNGIWNERHKNDWYYIICQAKNLAGATCLEVLLASC